MEDTREVHPLELENSITIDSENDDIEVIVKEESSKLLKQRKIVEFFKKPNELFKDIAICPLCAEKVVRNLFAEHLCSCLCEGSLIRAERRSPAEILSRAGYSQDYISQYAIEVKKKSLVGPSLECSHSSSAEDIYSTSENQQAYKTTLKCPICGQQIEATKMNEHLDDCV